MNKSFPDSSFIPHPFNVSIPKCRHGTHRQFSACDAQNECLRSFPTNNPDIAAKTFKTARGNSLVHLFVGYTWSAPLPRSAAGRGGGGAGFSRPDALPLTVNPAAKCSKMESLAEKARRTVEKDLLEVFYFQLFTKNVAKVR